MTISIDQTSCIKCGKCVKVCPDAIFTQSKTEETIGIVRPEECIACGHCVSVCPTSSVKHSEFPAEKIHAIDYQAMPSPEQVMQLLKARRSNRAISKEPVPPEMLDMIVEAARCAPTATNSQNVSFTVVTHPFILQELSAYTLEVFGSIVKKLENPFLKAILKPLMKQTYRYVPVFKRMKKDYYSGKYDPILRRATAVLVIHTPRSSRFGCQDSNLAYQNASIMAESLGVTQIYMGFVLTGMKLDRKKELKKLLEIDGKIHAMMALGMPAFRYPNCADKQEVKVSKLK